MAVLDSNAKRRVQSLVEVLQRMGLLSTLDLPKPASPGAAEPLTVLVVEPEAWFDEPKCIHSEHGLASLLIICLYLSQPHYQSLQDFAEVIPYIPF